VAKLPKLFNTKLYKTGQTRGADDDEIYQNRVSRSSTVLIPYSLFDLCADANNEYENGYIVLIKPDVFFGSKEFREELLEKGIELGKNA
jgi:hypothetical protein